MEKLVFISHSSLDKPVADAICHRLEEKGIRCWIAPRDIRSTDWAGSIMDGLKRSEVFVVVISRHSIDSPEVTKEVTEATRTCRYLLPFKVDEENLSDRLRYHLGPCHWLDAVDPPLEKRIEELAYRILHLSEEDAVYQNQDRWKLTERMALPRASFQGRDEEIAEIAARLPEEHVLFLQGMGGIGKSEIAKGYAKAYRDRYDIVVFASYTSNLTDLVCGDGLPIENLHRADGEPDEAWFRRKLDAYASLASDRTLLIIDNFDTEEDSALEALINMPGHLLFTTRNDHSDYPTLPVGPIRSFETVRSIFRSHYGKTADQETVDKILRLVGCHTITVELIAKQMKASFLKPDKMLQRLQETGVNLQLKEKIRREESGEKRSSFDYIRQLFSLSGLTEEEKHLLCCMCLVPISGIPVQELGEILELDDYDAVNSLLQKSWLMLGEEDDILRLHPVIADVVRAELHPTPLSCADYVRGLRRRVYMMWFFPQEERSMLYPLVAKINQDHPEPVRELYSEYASFVNIPWICGDFSASFAAGQRVYAFAVREYGEVSEEAARAALFVAGAYLNSGDEAGAEPWYRRSYETFLQSGAPVNAQMAQSCFKVGRCAAARGEFAAAHDYYDKALVMYEELLAAKKNMEGKKYYPDQYEDLFVAMERLRMAEGDYRGALALCEQTFTMIKREYSEPSSSWAYCLQDLGICCSMLGRYDEARTYLEQELDINLTNQGKVSVMTVLNREAIADNALRSGDPQTARGLYRELEFDLEKDFGADNPQTVRIREKLAAVS